MARLERKWDMEQQQSRENSDALEHVPASDQQRNKTNRREQRILLELGKILRRILDCTQATQEHNTAVLSMQLIRSENQRAYSEQMYTRILQKLADLEMVIASMLIYPQDSRLSLTPEAVEELQGEVRELRETKMRMQSKCKLLSEELDKAKKFPTEMSQSVLTPDSTDHSFENYLDETETIRRLRKNLELAETFQEELEQMVLARDEKVAHLERCLLSERRRTFQENGYQPEESLVDLQASEILQEIVCLFGLEDCDPEWIVDQLVNRKLQYETRIFDLESTRKKDSVEEKEEEDEEQSTREDHWQQRIDELEASRNDLRTEYQGRLRERDAQLREMQQTLELLQSQLDRSPQPSAEKSLSSKSQTQHMDDESAERGCMDQLAIQLGLEEGSCAEQIMNAIQQLHSINNDLFDSKQGLESRLVEQDIILEEWNAYVDKLESQWGEERATLQSRCQEWEDAAIAWEVQREDVMREQEVWKSKIEQLETQLATACLQDVHSQELESELAFLRDQLQQCQPERFEEMATKVQHSEYQLQSHRKELEKQQQLQRHMEQEHNVLLIEFGMNIGWT